MWSCSLTLSRKVVGRDKTKDWLPSANRLVNEILLTPACFFIFWELLQVIIYLFYLEKIVYNNKLIQAENPARRWCVEIELTWAATGWKFSKGFRKGLPERTRPLSDGARGVFLGCLLKYERLWT